MTAAGDLVVEVGPWSGEAPARVFSAREMRERLAANLRGDVHRRGR